MRESLFISTSDAKGEEGCFQGKTRFFHWELLFFQRQAARRFLLCARLGAHQGRARGLQRHRAGRAERGTQLFMSQK
jgi:hypothetical protein